MSKYRIALIAIALLAAASASAYLLYRSERGRRQALSEPVPERLDAETSALATGNAADASVKIFAYAPGQTNPQASFLGAQQRTIFKTDDVALKARQIVNEVLKVGPPFPADARLRQVYLLPDGTAVVDLSGETASELNGGVTSEMAAIRSITQSLRINLPQVKRVKFLIEGQERPTFGGHVSIREPFM
jgi:hypothetical protein